LESKTKIFLVFFAFIITVYSFMWAKDSTNLSFNEKNAYNFSKLALTCITKQYPNKPSHVINNKNEILSPKKLHPAFYGCFDWHSSVHGHWMLVKLLKMFPQIRNSKQIIETLNINLAPANIIAETEYFRQPNRKSFERMYGWAWFLKLIEELNTWDNKHGNRWLRNLKPLENEIVNRYIEFLPKLTYPIRTGVHPNTAFALSFGVDYADTIKNKNLRKIIKERALFYYLQDRNYPASWEPGGEDFFSPALLEANLMRKIIPLENFKRWLDRFLPDLKKKLPETLFTPAEVSDRSDPKIVHLDGLNLSRAWCMFGISSILKSKNPLKKILAQTGELHLKATLPHITSGNYEGEHWLASFAVYSISKKD